MSENAKTIADVRGGLRASPRGPSWPPSPRRPRRGAHVPGALDTIENHRYASGARASSAVPGGTEQHIGQLLDGAAFREARRFAITGLEPACGWTSGPPRRDR